MSLDTTLYIHDSTMGLINDACTLTGTGHNDMIVLLLKNSMLEPKQEVMTGRLVRYQGRDRRESWHTVHVRFREDMADFVKDLRGFFRLSVSFILALAARAYLNDIVRKSRIQGKCDNYPFSNYIVSKEVNDGLIFWRICWGYPLKH
jgi:hypothetical protein